MQKRILAIHDISCFGKCSLTVALPIISATGSECTVLPTAVLSTYTGVFSGYTYRDLSEDLEPIMDHWRSLNIHFDSLYTGYLGSFQQIDIIGKMIDDLKEQGTCVIVDPVMGDDGELYPEFPDSFPSGMRKLCSKADLIIPNITEACLLTGKEYQSGPYSKEWVEDILVSLSDIGCKNIILTGVIPDDHNLGVASYDAVSGKIGYYLKESIPGTYCGTGDMFGSVIAAAYTKGLTLDKAVGLAVDFVHDSISLTNRNGTDPDFGVDFEENIPSLIRKMGL